MDMANGKLKSSLLSLSLISAATLATPSVYAQSEDQIKDLLACDKIQKSEDRLECFNAVIAILKQQEDQRGSSGQTASGNQRRSRNVDVSSPRGSDFGLSQAQIEAREQARNPSRKKGPKEQVFQFTHSWQDLNGKYYFLMSNGQIWKEIGGSHLIVPKRAKTIRIKRNIMGGYAAFIQGMNGRKGAVKRIR